MYEESLRMPLIVRWPGRVEGGSRNTQLVQNLDFAPTFLEAAGLEAPAEMQGRSLMPILMNGEAHDWRDAVYYHYYEFPAVHSVPRHYGVRTDRFKLIYYYQLGEWELFDLQTDPNEMHSVYDDPAYAAIVVELKARLRRLQSEYGDIDPEAPTAHITQPILRRRAAAVATELVLHLEQADAIARDDLDPSAKPLTVGACCTGRMDGVIVAHGGEVHGYSLFIRDGRPHFAIRSGGSLFEVVGEGAIPSAEPVHLAGTLDAEGRLGLFLNGRETGSAGGALIVSKPADSLTIGRDGSSHVGAYDSDGPFTGTLRDIRIYWGKLDAAALRRWATEALQETHRP
jgi:hypothetical protein